MQLPPGRHVFFDFETTGLDPKVDEPIEVAAIEVIDGEIGAVYTSFVRPQERSLSAEITELTGICEAMVATAPLPETVAKELTAFFEDSPRIAHNAPFDEAVAARLCGNALPPAPSLDTVELAYMLRPDLPSAALSALVDALGVTGSPIAHRAEADVRATIAVTSRLLDGLAARPTQLHAILAPLSVDIRWTWAPTLRALQTILDARSRTEPLATNATLSAPSAPSAPASEDASDTATSKPMGPLGDVVPIAQDEIDAFFDSKAHDASNVETSAHDKQASPTPSKLAAVMPGYEARPQQRDMARAVAQALNDGKHALIETPTGVGKSLAYLVPLVLFARANRTTITVSTNTRGLQDQLDQKDLPLLDHALGGDGTGQDLRPEALRWQVVKGRANYICLHAWRDQLAALDFAASEAERVGLAYLGAIAHGPGNGDLSQVRSRMRGRYPALSYLVERVRGEDCSGKNRHASCPAGRIATRAESAHLVIVNHALLMTGSRLLPEIDHLVIDEAHALEQRAASFFSQEVSGRELIRVVWRLGRSLEDRGYAHTLRDLLRSRGLGVRPEEAQNLVKKTRHLGEILDAWKRGLNEIVFAHRDDDDNMGYASLEVALRTLRPRQERRFETLVESLGQSLHALRHALDHALRALEELSLQDSKLRARRRLLERNLADAKFLVYEQVTILEELADEEKPLQIRLLRSHADQPERWALRVEPLAVAKELQEKLFERYRSVVVTSATLALGDQGDYIAQRIGYPSDPERATPLLRLSAPWDSEETAINLLVDDIPPIREAGARAKAMATLIADVGDVLGGRTLVLFCAAARMRQTAELARPLLAARGLTLLEQERDGGMRDLIQKMRRDEKTVLFGVQSFWTGIDITGPALSCVIVERLPFLSQKRPVVAARMALEGEGFAGFLHYLLPAALLDLRQGAGRLLRRGDDKGIVVLCHEQLSTKRYAKRVIEVLPGSSGEQVPAEEIGSGIARACDTLGIPHHRDADADADAD